MKEQHALVCAIRETASTDYGPAQIAVWSRLDREAWAAQRPHRITLVARVGSEAAGFADLEPDGHLDSLCVPPRFGRRGVARRLVAAAEAHAVALDLDGLHTEASLTAHPFFDTDGFRVVAEETVARGGQLFRRYRMGKDGIRPRRDPDR